jgi:hypothetical protein
MWARLERIQARSLQGVKDSRKEVQLALCALHFIKTWRMDCPGTKIELGDVPGDYCSGPCSS